MKRLLNIGTAFGIIVVIGFVMLCFEKQVFVSPEVLQQYLMQMGNLLTK